jgi:hypothetical protein
MNTRTFPSIFRGGGGGGGGGGGEGLKIQKLSKSETPVSNHCIFEELFLPKHSQVLTMPIQAVAEPQHPLGVP